MRLKHILFIILASVILMAGLEGASFTFRMALGPYLSKTYASLRDERARLHNLDLIEKKGGAVDRRRAAEVIEQSKKAGLDVLPKLVLEDVFKFSGEVLLPLSGVPGRTIITGPDNGYWPLILHDAHGFNNDPSVWDAPADITVFGASTIYGFGVEREKNFATRLGEMTGLNVINFGYPGPASPHRYVAVIKEYFDALQNPDIILWGLWDNLDFTILHGPVLDTLERYKEPGFRQGLVTRQAELERAYLDSITPSIRKSAYEFLPIGDERSHLVDVFLLRNTRLILQRVRSVLSPPPPALAPGKDIQACTPDIIERHKAWLDVGMLEAKARGARIIATYFPLRARLDGALDENSFCYKDFINFFKSQGIPVIDLVEEARRAGLKGDDFFEIGVTNHYSAHGHERIAAMIAKSLKEDGHLNKSR